MLDRGLRPLGHAAGDEEGDDDDERPPEAEQQSVDPVIFAAAKCR
jgi:hypothetical protein